MPGLMDGKRGLVMGVANDHSIAWGIAKTLAHHGAKLAFTYQGDALAKRVKPLAEQAGSSFVMPCDVEDIASVDAVFEQVKKQWGTMDFLVHAVAFSDKNELKGHYAEFHARELHPHHGDLLLRLYRSRAARGGADAEWRLHGDTDL